MNQHKPSHLNVYSFIGVCVGERRRSVDERHDAQPVVHQGHVGNNNIHDGLRGAKRTMVICCLVNNLDYLNPAAPCRYFLQNPKLSSHKSLQKLTDIKF